MPNTPTPAAVFAPTPMTPSQLDARSLIEALRVGVAPAHHAQELTIGLEEPVGQPGQRIGSRPTSAAATCAPSSVNMATAKVTLWN